MLSILQIKLTRCYFTHKKKEKYRARKAGRYYHHIHRNVSMKFFNLSNVNFNPNLFHMHNKRKRKMQTQIKNIY